MAVKDFMTQNPICLNLKAPVEKAVQLFADKSIHHIPVTIDGQLLGIISDRDVLNCKTDPNFTEVKKIMTANPICVTQNTSTTKAAKILLEQQISALPVVNDKLELVGILSWKDILRAAVSKKESWLMAEDL